MPEGVSYQLAGPLRKALCMLWLPWPTDEEELAEAYRREAKWRHPDRGGSTEAFIAVKEARDYVAGVLAGELSYEPEAERADPDERADFESGFRISKRGNRWRHWQGMTLTVFQRQGDGWYGWCVADDQERRFSRGSFATEEEALDDLASEVGV